jgi:hypothetical protein
VCSKIVIAVVTAFVKLSSKIRHFINFDVSDYVNFVNARIANAILIFAFITHEYVLSKSIVELFDFFSWECEFTSLIQLCEDAINQTFYSWSSYTMSYHADSENFDSINTRSSWWFLFTYSWEFFDHLAWVEFYTLTCD